MGDTAWFGPLDKRDSWVWKRGVPEKLITHLIELLLAGSCVELARGFAVRFLSLSLPINLKFIDLSIPNLSKSRFSYRIDEIGAIFHCC